MHNSRRMLLQTQSKGTTKSGWINAELFTTWITHFIKHSGAPQDNKVLVILDNHESHLSIETHDFCCKNAVIMISLLPLTSHRLQLLDVTVFSSLKVAYNQECDRYMKYHPGQGITQYEIAYLFNAPYSRMSSKAKSINGFQTTRILPLNPDKFTEEDFALVSADMSFGRQCASLELVHQQ